MASEGVKILRRSAFAARLMFSLVSFLLALPWFGVELFVRFVAFKVQPDLSLLLPPILGAVAWGAIAVVVYAFAGWLQVQADVAEKKLRQSPPPR